MMKTTFAMLLLSFSLPSMANQVNGVECKVTLKGNNDHGRTPTYLKTSQTTVRLMAQAGEVAQKKIKIQRIFVNSNSTRKMNASQVFSFLDDDNIIGELNKNKVSYFRNIISKEDFHLGMSFENNGNNEAKLTFSTNIFKANLNTKGFVKNYPSTHNTLATQGYEANVKGAIPYTTYDDEGYPIEYKEHLANFHFKCRHLDNKNISDSGRDEIDPVQTKLRSLRNSARQE